MFALCQCGPQGWTPRGLDVHVVLDNLSAHKSHQLERLTAAIDPGLVKPRVTGGRHRERRDGKGPQV